MSSPRTRLSLTRPAATRPAELQARALRQTRREHSTETAEDYVEAIAELTVLEGEARAAGRARRLGGWHVTGIRAVAPPRRGGRPSSTERPVTADLRLRFKPLRSAG